MGTIFTTLEVMGLTRAIVGKINEYIESSRATNKLLRSGNDYYKAEIEITNLEAFCIAIEISIATGSDIPEAKMINYSKGSIRQLFELRDMAPGKSNDINMLIELIKPFASR